MKPTIDISNITRNEYKEHMRRLEQLTTCPCNECTAVCDRWSTIQECKSYQQWLDIQYRRKR